jgi:hypothetical protein
MNGRIQMQGGKNWILLKYKPVLLGLSLVAGNLVKPLMSLYGTEWRERGYGDQITMLYVMSIFSTPVVK